jgi:opacity protein-like surface antigen
MIRSTLRGLAAASLVLALTSSVAAAQMAEPRFGVKAGIALPTGDFGDVAGLGLHLGGHFSLPLQNAFSLRLDAEYATYGGEDNTGLDNVSLFGGMANLVYRMQTQSELKPYFLGGVGMYNARFEATGGGSASEADFAFNVGVGYDFKLGGSQLFTELRYLSVQTDGGATGMMPIVLGLRF